jgi:hypothetical protein
MMIFLNSVQSADTVNELDEVLCLWDSVVMKNFWESAKKNTLESARTVPHDAMETWLDKGRVCFAHFTYLSKEVQHPMITHDVLRYAYRRSSAIIVDEGRRGIDWIIPVRIGEDTFVGLVGQDKSRLSDTLESLSAADNETTHWKLNMHYF